MSVVGLQSAFWIFGPDAFAPTMRQSTSSVMYCVASTVAPSRCTRTFRRRPCETPSPKASPSVPDTAKCFPAKKPRVSGRRVSSATMSATARIVVEGAAQDAAVGEGAAVGVARPAAFFLTAARLRAGAPAAVSVGLREVLGHFSAHVVLGLGDLGLREAGQIVARLVLRPRLHRT